MPAGSVIVERMQRSLRQRFPLQPGSHATRADGMCTMELVAWLAGEQHSDEPRCACPVLATIVRCANDRLRSSFARDRYLRPLAPLLVGTRTHQDVESARAIDALDAVGRRFAPLALERAGLIALADEVRHRDPIAGPADALAMASRLADGGPAVRAARWTLRFAGRGFPRETWLPGVGLAVEEANAWGELSAFVRELVAAGSPARS